MCHDRARKEEFAIAHLQPPAGHGDASCECYATVKGSFARLMPERPQGLTRIRSRLLRKLRRRADIPLSGWSGHSSVFSCFRLWP